MSPLRPGAPAGQDAAAAAAPAAVPTGDGPRVAVGRVVHVEMTKESNYTRLAPAIVTNVHGGIYDYVNATLFPDLAAPAPMGSIPRKDLVRPGWQGPVWFWPPKV